MAPKDTKVKCKHCPEDTGDDQVDVCEKCWQKNLDEKKAEAIRRRPNYHTVESCASCRHCFQWWDPESWDGSCNVEDDVPVRTRKEHMDLLYGRRKEHEEEYERLVDWQMDNSVSPNCKCDRYEKGIPKSESDSEEPRKPRRKRKQ